MAATNPLDGRASPCRSNVETFGFCSTFLALFGTEKKNAGVYIASVIPLSRDRCTHGSFLHRSAEGFVACADKMGKNWVIVDGIPTFVLRLSSWVFG